MKKDDYIMHLEILLEDLLDEIKSLSDDYGLAYMVEIAITIILKMNMNY